MAWSVDARGFVFYTNLESRKARALTANPYAALTFYWPPLDKQVRVEGNVERVSEADADAYFATRPPFWSGFRVVARSIEFWTRDPTRLHERVIFQRRNGGWERSLFFP